jgi:urease accessory protein
LGEAHYFSKSLFAKFLNTMQKPATPIPYAVLGSTLFVLAPPAEAHHAEFMSNAPFLQGLSMPVHGLDHLLSAIAVGLVASRIPSRGGVALLLSVYTLVALAGGLLNVSGVALPDLMVPLTVALTALLLWRGGRGGWVPAGAAIATAGFCHGDALLSRHEAGGHWTLFAAGCLCSTLLVSAAALLAGRVLAEARLRLAGAVLLAGAGLLMMFPEANAVLIQLLEGAR